LHAGHASRQSSPKKPLAHFRSQRVFKEMKLCEACGSDFLSVFRAGDDWCVLIKVEVGSRTAFWDLWIRFGPAYPDVGPRFRFAERPAIPDEQSGHIDLRGYFNYHPRCHAVTILRVVKELLQKDARNAHMPTSSRYPVLDERAEPRACK